LKYLFLRANEDFSEFTLHASHIEEKVKNSMAEFTERLKASKTPRPPRKTAGAREKEEVPGRPQEPGPSCESVIVLNEGHIGQLQSGEVVAVGGVQLKYDPSGDEGDTVAAENDRI